MHSGVLRQSISVGLQAHSWSEVTSTAFWTKRGAVAPRAPALQPLMALARDALSSTPLDETGLPPLAAATAWLEHVLAWWDRTHAAASRAEVPSGGEEAYGSSQTGACWPPWAATAPVGSPLTALALHMCKLQCPLAIGRLWAAFIEVLAVEHCETGTPVGNLHAGTTAAQLRGASRAATSDPSTASRSVGRQLQAELDSDSECASSPSAGGSTGQAAETLAFMPPYLELLLQQVNDCLNALATCDEAGEHVQASTQLDTIQEEDAAADEQPGSDAVGHLDDADQAGALDAFADTKVGVLAGSSVAAASAEQPAQSSDASDRQDNMADAPPAQAQEAPASPQHTAGPIGEGIDEPSNAAATTAPVIAAAASSINENQRSATHAHAEHEGVATDRDAIDGGDHDSNEWLGEGPVVLEAAVRGAIAALKDASPAHVLASSLLSACQVCFHRAQYFVR